MELSKRRGTAADNEIDSMYPTSLQLDDNELCSRILSAFGRRRPRPTQGIAVTVTGGVAVLSGKVRSQRDKHLLLDTCGHVAGVVRVIDRLALLIRDNSGGQARDVPGRQ